MYIVVVNSELVFVFITLLMLSMRNLFRARPWMMSLCFCLQAFCYSVYMHARLTSFM